MIVIRIVIPVAPDKKAAFTKLLEQEAREVRRLEGCISFEVFEQVSDKNTLLLYEEWQRLEDFDAYRTSEAFKETGQQLFALMNGKPDSAYYSAAQFS